MVENVVKNSEEELLSSWLSRLKKVQSNSIYCERVTIDAIKNNDYDKARNSLIEFALKQEEDVFNEYRSWWTNHKNKYLYSSESVDKINTLWKVSLEVIDENIIKISLPPLDRKNNKTNYNYLKTTLFYLINKAVNDYKKSSKERDLNLFMSSASILYLSIIDERKVCPDADNSEIKIVQDVLSQFFFSADDMLNLTTIFGAKKGDKEQLDVYITAKANCQHLLKYLR